MPRGRGRQLSTEVEDHSIDSQYRRLEATNERLLKILEDQNRRGELDQESKLFKRLGGHRPPFCNGESDPVKLENWIDQIEKVLEVVNCPRGLMVKIASFYLEDTASMWWKTVKTRGDNIGMTWEEFLVRLRTRFYPTSLQRRKEGEFHTLSQEKMSVLEYSAKFTKLSKFAPDFVTNDRMKASRFFEGLNLNLQKYVTKYRDFQDLFDSALEKERVQEKKDRFNRERGKHVVYPSKKPKIENPKFQY
ncbi:unnamed protein product [Amaranthus hypochondriacus]